MGCGRRLLGAPPQAEHAEAAAAVDGEPLERLPQLPLPLEAEGHAAHARRQRDEAPRPRPQHARHLAQRRRIEFVDVRLVQVAKGKVDDDDVDARGAQRQPLRAPHRGQQPAPGGALCVAALTRDPLRDGAVGAERQRRQPHSAARRGARARGRGVGGRLRERVRVDVAGECTSASRARPPRGGSCRRRTSGRGARRPALARRGRRRATPSTSASVRRCRDAAADAVRLGRRHRILELEAARQRDPDNGGRLQHQRATSSVKPTRSTRHSGKRAPTASPTCIPTAVESYACRPSRTAEPRNDAHLSVTVGKQPAPRRQRLVPALRRADRVGNLREAVTFERHCGDGDGCEQALDARIAAILG